MKKSTKRTTDKKTVPIQGKGIYTGEAYKTFEIARADASVSVSSKTVKISGNQFIALKPGKAVITISAKQGQNYNALPATKVTITVRPLNTTGGCPEISQKGSGKSILEACEIHQWIPDSVQYFCKHEKSKICYGKE